MTFRNLSKPDTERASEISSPVEGQELEQSISSSLLKKKKCLGFFFSE